MRDETDINTQTYVNAGYTLVSGEDYTTPDNDPTGLGTHGTHVAGIVAASTNNSKGVAGIGWNNKIVPVRCGFILKYNGQTYGFLETDDWIRGLNWVRNNNQPRANVVNMSFGGGPYNSSAHSAIINAVNSGIVICASSGNNNSSVKYPAAYTQVIAVGATNQSDVRCTPSDWGTDYGSCFGSNLSIVAPGNAIKSSSFSGSSDTYENKSGTSMASPMVAGAVSLVLSVNPTLTPSEVQSILETSAEKVSSMGGNNFHNEYGYGRLDVYQSLLNTPRVFQFVNKIETTENYGNLIVDNNTNNPINSGNYIPLNSGTQHSARTNEVPFLSNWNYTGTTQKFNKWYESNSSYNLTLTFTVDQTTPIKKDAQFLSTKAVTVQSYLEEGVQGGSIQFKDPWFYYSSGSNWYQSNVFKPYGASYNFDLNSYGGVFLGQGSPNWSPPYYSVKTTSPQTIYVQGKNRSFYFQNWESTGASFQNSGNLETPVVFNQAGATVKAVMKGTGLSNNSSSFTHNNQRKIAMDNTGTLYRVYESLGKVWLEISTDDGSTWSIFNSGQPLTTNEAKLPSIVGSDNQGSVQVTYQEKNGSYYKIILKKIYSGGVLDTDIIYQEPYVSYSQDAYPVVSMSGNGTTFVVWRREVSNPFYGYSGLHYWVGSSNTYGTNPLSSSVEIVPNTNANSTKPSIVANKATNYYVEESHLVWQQNSSSGSSIKYTKMDWNDNTDEVDFSNYSEVSSTSGYDDNYNPSIAITLNRPRVTWLTEHPITYIQEGNLRTKGSYGTSWGTLIKFSYGGGDNVESIVVNARNTSYGFVVAYAGDGNEVRYYKANRTNQAAVPTTTDRYVQLSNGDDYTDMAIETFNTSSAPYYFNSTLVDATLSKTSSENDVIKGREIILTKGKSKIILGVNNIIVDNDMVDFVEVEDTLIAKTKEEVVGLFETNNFLLTDNSNFEFDLNYALFGEEKLEKHFDLEFQLVDAKTNKTIGVLEKMETSKIEANEVNAISFEIDTKGIINKQVKLKLVIDESVVDNIAIASTYKTGKGNLPKENNRVVAYDNTLGITDYSLSQNYPNPFNPSTTIKYQIPEDGFVSVKIYDITGSKVTTLVNRAQTKGRYQVTFDASNLSSGVYFYRIQSGSFVKTMKMILLR